jgi:hypothetical protein
VLFHDIAIAWATVYPGSAYAAEAVALSLAMLGDPSALDGLRRAMRLATTAEERMNVASSELWTQLAFAVPGNLDGLRRTRWLADSLLDSNPPVSGKGDPGVLAGIAALSGRASLAAAYLRRQVAEEPPDRSLPLRASAAALLVYSALGGPEDSLTSLESRVRALVNESVPQARRGDAEFQWLGRAASLAFATCRLPVSGSFAGRGVPLLEAQAALARGDTAVARRELAKIRQVRQQSTLAEFTFDGLYPEAELVLALEGPQPAADWLDPTLRALPQVAPDVLSSPASAGALVRTMALRGRLAARLGDRQGAATWARAVGTLWSGANEFLTAAPVSATAACSPGRRH